MLWLDRLGQLMELLANIAVVVITSALVFNLIGQVAARYVMKLPFPWMEELARYLMIWAAMLASSVAVRRHAHVGVTLLTSRLPVKWFLLSTIIAYAGMLAFLWVLIRHGWAISVFVERQRTTTLGISMFWAYLAVPVGASFMALQVVVHLFNAIISFQKKENSIRAVEETKC